MSGSMRKVKHRPSRSVALCIASVVRSALFLCACERERDYNNSNTRQSIHTKGNDLMLDSIRIDASLNSQMCMYIEFFFSPLLCSSFFAIPPDSSLARGHGGGVELQIANDNADDRDGLDQGRLSRKQASSEERVHHPPRLIMTTRIGSCTALREARADAVENYKKRETMSVIVILETHHRSTHCVRAH